MSKEQIEQLKKLPRDNHGNMNFSDFIRVLTGLSVEQQVLAMIGLKISKKD